jgi:hypothetical protein
LYVSIGADFFGFSLFIQPKNFVGFDYEFLPLYIKLLPLVLSIIGFFLAFIFYGTSVNFFYRLPYNIFLYKIYHFLNKK